jgi:hypothetical protein
MPNDQTKQLGCGSCGYPTRGISELKCPECGADLTEVGTIKLGSRRRLITLWLYPLIFSAVFFTVAFLVSLQAGQVLPTYTAYKITLQFDPASDAYEDIIVWADADAVTVPGQSTTGSINVTTSNAGPTPTTAMTMSFTGTTLDMRIISLGVRPRPETNLPLSRSLLNVYPDTGEAEWYDTKTQSMQPIKNYSEQDVLALLNSIDADINDPAVINEARQLHQLITGLINNQQQYNLQGFSSAGYGYGGQGTVGPPWAMPTYWFVCVVIWLIGLIFLVRSGKKRA